MIAQALLWWSGRSDRERVMLGIMGGLVGLMLFWLVIIRPIDNALADARQRLDVAAESSGRVAAVADGVRQARRLAPASLSASLTTAVGQAAEGAGFTLARLDAQGPDRAIFTISTARSPALFGWLAVLQRQGVIVEKMTLRTNSDATLAVEGTLRVRAR
jgi:general secretion pathway protein M